MVAQGYTQEEGIDYDEVFAPVSRIETIRLFLAYASFMRFIVYQMDVKSAFLYGTIEEEVYVCQPPSFEDPLFPDKVYKDKGDILLVQVYFDDIIFGSTKKSLCVKFEQMMHKRFQMSSIGEITFFLGLQVKQKDDGIFISQDKYVADILKKFNFSSVKTASTLIETNKALLKDEEAEDVDVHLYRSMIGSLMYLTTSRPDIMFAVCACARFQVTPKVSHLHAVKRIFRYLKGQPKLGLWYPRDSPFDLEAFYDSDYARASLDMKSTTRSCQFLGKRLISWQCKKQTIDANSTTEAEYVVANNCYGQIALAEPFNDVYVTPVHTKKVFTNMKRQNKDFSGTVTPLFASMLVPQVVEGEGSGQPSEPQPPSSTAPPSHEEQVTTVASQSQKTHTPRRAKRGRDTEIPQSSGPPKKVGDEAVYTGEDDRVVRAATTATSLEAEQESGNIHKTRSTATLNEPSLQGTGSGSGPRCQDTTLGDADAQTRFETASKQSRDPPLSEVNTSGSGEDSMEHQDDLTDFVPPTPHDSPLSGGHTPGSDEGRPNINELMAICTKFSNKVLALETSKTAQDLVITKLKKKVKRLEKKQRARTPRMKLFKIGTSRRKSLDKENNVEGDTVNDGGAVNTATTGVSAASASITTDGVPISTAEPRTPPTTTITAFEDEDLTIAQTLVKMRTEKDKKKRSKGIMQEPEKPPKNPIKAQIQMDEELAMRLHEEEKTELEKMQRERAIQEEASNVALITEFDDVQARMDADALLATRL
ncbi:putative ribonuclease H-like domain-containing protein [Tanacetum coccineum]|uniref:Ribonuclease H-like domain-containing protein n=1 Tax=Tanacetum coccineum TaxID=301880 RepID=A0ABQ5EY00_9ASTR